LFLEADAVKEKPQSSVNINNNQNIKRSRYFDEYDTDPQSNLLALELVATSSEQHRDKQKIKSTAEKITSFMKDVKNKVQGATASTKSPEELEKNPFVKSDVAVKSQQTATTQNSDNISIRILPNASKKLFTFLFVILAIAVFSTFYVINSRKPKERSSNVLPNKNKNQTSVSVEANGAIKIDNKSNNNKNNKSTKRVTIQDLDDSDAKNTDESSNNTNNNNVNDNNVESKKESKDESDPKEELLDEVVKNTNENTNEKDAENNSAEDKKDGSEQHKLNKDAEKTAEKVSPRRKVQSSPRVTEPDDKHLTSDNDEDDQDPEYEEEVHETIVVSSSGNQIRPQKTSRRVDEIIEEIDEHQQTILRLENEVDTADNKLKITELKVFVTKLKMKRMEIEEKMASNALSFEQIREMQRQNKFKRQAKMEEISKSSEYRNVKTTLTEKHNEIQAENLKLKEERNAREVAEQKRKHEKELQEMIWQEFMMMIKVTLIIFIIFWGIHLWQTMSFSVIVSLLRQKFGEFVAYLFPGTTRNLSFLGKVPVLGSLLSGAGSFMGILLLLLAFVAYAVAFWFMGPYFANALLVTIVMVGLGAWRHVVTGGATFVALASIEYIAVRQLKHHINSPKYSLIYIPFVVLAAALGYYTAFNVLSIEVPIQAATNTALVNNIWGKVSKLVFK
jgi:hypothetical protein